MDRCGIFIDAGHLLAEGGRLCCGTHERKRFTCDYHELVNGLTQRVLAHAQLPLLRMYWYDAANNAIPSLDHLTIAAAANVKLRLGRIIFDRQKGVDALIYRDLMTLARERAMATAYLLAGDEDVREGVVAAQDMGVRVVLIGIEGVKGSNQSEFLVREADDHILLEAAFWRQRFWPPILRGSSARLLLPARLTPPTQPRKSGRSSPDPGRPKRQGMRFSVSSGLLHGSLRISTLSFSTMPSVSWGPFRRSRNGGRNYGRDSGRRFSASASRPYHRRRVGFAPPRKLHRRSPFLSARARNRRVASRPRFRRPCYGVSCTYEIFDAARGTA
jgi:uncharacterized LabA/DUF88 family protein